MIRCFLSLNIERSLQNKLSYAQEDLKKELSSQKIKWEKADKFHLTLRFLGDTEPGKIKIISQELTGLKLGFEVISMTASGIGFFPNAKKPNIVFIALNEDGNSTGILVDEIDRALGKFGFKPDFKFVPHITMGRFRRDNRVKIEHAINVKIEPFEFKFDSFYLMKSKLKPGGSDYEVIKEFKFK